MSYRRVSGGEPISEDALGRRRPRRKAVGFGQVLRWIGIVVLLGVMYGVYGFVNFMLHIISHPHEQSPAYLPPDKNDGSMPVVEPLITNQTIFDVEATLWLNVTGYLSQHGSLGKKWDHLEIKEYQRGSRQVKEAVIYNGIVFKDLKLTSKQHASVSVRLPAAPFFEDPNLGPHLRSSFVVVPRSGVNMPEDAAHIQGKSAFPRSAPRSLARPGDSLQQQVDASSPSDANGTLSFSSTSSLYDISGAGTQQFYYRRHRVLYVKSQASYTFNSSDSVVHYDKSHPRNASYTSNSTHPVVLVNSTEIADYVRSTEAIRDSGVHLQNGTTFMTKQARFISTRTRLVILPHTPNLMKHHFQEGQEVVAQRLAGCYRIHAFESFPPCSPLANINAGQPGLHHLLFTNVLNFDKETSPGSEVFDPGERYPPPMVALDTSFAPFARALPDFYSQGAAELLAAGVIEYEWDLYFAASTTFMQLSNADAFSGAKIHQDRFPLERVPTLTSAGYSEAVSPEDHATKMAFASDRLHANSKPWRLFLSSMMSDIWSVARRIVALWYWAGTATTDGISIPSILFLSAAHFLYYGREFYQLKGWRQLNIDRWLSAWLWRIATQYFCLTLVLRLTWNGWRLDRSKPTHRERASARLDSKIPLYLRFLSVGVFFILFYTRVLDKVVLRPALGVNSDEIVATSTGIPWIKIFICLGRAFGRSASIGQAWFNHQSATFAGFSKVGVVLDCIDALFVGVVLKHVSWLSGHLDARSKLTFADLIWPVITTVLVLQAILLPSVSQDAVDEDEE